MKLSGKRSFIIGTLAGILLVAGFALPVFAAGSNICKTYGAECSETEVGVFMAGISSTCGNEGTCSVADILQVFINVGNFVLKIVGALVFMMYAIGGFYYLFSGGPGQAKYVQKAKDTIKMATLGLMIVFFANAGMRLIENTLLDESIFYAEDGEVYVTCAPGTAESPSPSSDDACGDNKKCDDFGGCKTECEITYLAEYSAASDTMNFLKPHACIDTRTTGHSIASCQKDLCPGDDFQVCCQAY